MDVTCDSCSPAYVVRWHTSDPYANSFNFNDSGAGHQDDVRKPNMTKHVFEGKYELDSLMAAIKLSYNYWNSTKDATCFLSDDTWHKAMTLVVATVTEQQKGTEEEGDNFAYKFERMTSVATDTLMLDGRGPVANRTGTLVFFLSFFLDNCD